MDFRLHNNRLGGYRFDAELGRGIAMNDDFEFFNERLFYNSETGIFYWKNTELVSWVVIVVERELGIYLMLRLLLWKQLNLHESLSRHCDR